MLLLCGCCGCCYSYDLCFYHCHCWQAQTQTRASLKVAPRLQLEGIAVRMIVYANSDTMFVSISACRHFSAHLQPWPRGTCHESEEAFLWSRYGGI